MAEAHSYEQMPKERERPRRRNHWFDAGAVVLALALGLAGAALLTWRTLHVGPLTVTARPAFGLSGRTTVRLPPFGEAYAHTHRGPARLVLTVESVDVPAVQRLFARGSSGSSNSPGQALAAQASSATATVSDVIQAESRSLRRDIASLVVVAALVCAGGCALVLLAFRRRGSVIAVGAALGFAVVMASAATAAATFDPASLSAPHLKGALAYVPRLQTVFSARLSSIEALRGQVSKVAEDLAAYYADPRSIGTGGGLPNTMRVLHVSDLHMDPVGAELARSLVRSYDATLVIDTGDLAMAGSAQEASLIPSLVETAVPEIFVPGNHDSQAIVSALSVLGNVTVATTGTVNAKGLTIVPIPDPSGEAPGIEPDRAAVQRATDEAAARIRALDASGGPMPDIIAMHNPLAERDLIGLAPLLLSGHTHTARLYRDAKDIRLNSGTLGGMPYDPVVSGRRRLPHGASVLYYTSSLPRRLVAIDRISVGVDGTTTLDRTVVDRALLP